MSTKHSPIRILIAEDHLIARAGMEAVVNSQPDMTVVAEATNGEQAALLYREHRPDLCLMDMWMPGMNGFDAVAAILAEFPEARIIGLSTFGGDEDIRRALAAGAQAFLTKDAPRDELIGSIRAVHAGQHYLPASVEATLAAKIVRPDLTVREVEVLRLLTRGLTNKQIAYELRIVEDTAKNHVKSILRKLEVQDRTQAATEAISRGFVHFQPQPTGGHRPG